MKNANIISQGCQLNQQKDKSFLAHYFDAFILTNQSNLVLALFKKEKEYMSMLKLWKIGTLQKSICVG